MFFGKEKTLRAGPPRPIFCRQGRHSGGHQVTLFSYWSITRLPPLHCWRRPWRALPAIATLKSLFELSGFLDLCILNNFNYLFFFFYFLPNEIIKHVGTTYIIQLARSWSLCQFLIVDNRHALATMILILTISISHLQFLMTFKVIFADMS